MQRCLRLLLCLPLLATTACAADAIAGPEPAPEPAAEALARAAPEPQPAETGTQALEAPAPGVLVRHPGPHTGAAAPRYIIDGVPATSAQALAALDADSVHSIEVLKGAGWAALHGCREMTGIVIITTRQAAASRRR